MVVNRRADRDIERLRHRFCAETLYGFIIGIFAVLIASFIICYQVTGRFCLYGMSIEHEGHIGLRVLYLMPFLLAFWGQRFGGKMVLQMGDVIEQRATEFEQINKDWMKKSHYDATHDPLTGLTNRVEFYNQLKKSILLADREDRELILLSLDLDSFKDINEVYGNDCGDALLICIADRLKNILSRDDWVSRTGSDEFSVLSVIRTGDQGTGIATKIQEVFKSPFLIEGNRMDIRGSIGISAYPQHGNTAELLMRKAEQAMHLAKKNDHGYAVYSLELRTENSRRIRLLRDLKLAIENEQLSLYYQPKVNLKNKSICSLEALLRWRHDDFGFISPEEFIPLAEANRLITPITYWVASISMEKIKAWHNEGIAVGMCLNISTKDLNEPDFPKKIANILSALKLDPGLFTLEITENSVMQDPRQSLHVIRQLSELGLRISIDDFGTGYSSLAYLSKLSVNELKIDRSFIIGMDERDQDAIIVKATIDLAHNLGIVVTAEGIEDERIMERLDHWGCDLGQGNYFSPPLSEGDLQKWFRETGWY